MSQKLKQDIIQDGSIKDRIIVMILFDVVASATLLLTFFAVDRDFFGMAVFIYIVIILIVVLACGHYYVLNEEAIFCHIFGYTYRKISWDNVIQIGIMHVQLDITHDANIIVLTPKGCPKFEPGRDDPTKYYNEYTHPPKLEKLPTPVDKKRLRETVRLIEKYYGPLDYGYDKLF